MHRRINLNALREGMGYSPQTKRDKETVILRHRQAATVGQ